jgi:hypothetical protein
LVLTAGFAQEQRRPEGPACRKCKCQYSYDCLSLPLPPDESCPQPVLLVQDGFRCRSCRYLSQSRKAIQEHGNKEHSIEHSIKHTIDEELFTTVRLQTWCRGKRERYWVVDEGRVDALGESRDVNNSSSSSGSDTAIKAEITEWLKKEEGQYQVSTIAADVDPWL